MSQFIIDMMEIKNWNFSDENRKTFERMPYRSNEKSPSTLTARGDCPKYYRQSRTRSVRKWIKGLSNKNSPNYNYIKSVLTDAEKLNYRQYSTRYYFCAKFIRHFLIDFDKYFRFIKAREDKVEWVTTCCRAYAAGFDCDGVCCRGNSSYFDCGCSKKSRPKYCVEIDNCYDDCCQIFKYKVTVPDKEFEIHWISI